ncbi:MAG: primosomal protein N' [Myxococcaceae bacterium]
MPLIEVSVPAAGIPNALTYELPESLWSDSLVGRRVRVTLKNRPVVGVIIGESISAVGKTKSIEALLDDAPIVTLEQIALCRFVSDYYIAPLGEVIRLCLPPDTPRTMKKAVLTKRRKSKTGHETRPDSKAIDLNPEQAAALEQIQKNGAFLLEGVTGSGKTEVYIHAAKEALSQRKSVLVIVPEIGLTPQLKDRFEAQLQEPIVMMHSGLKPTERHDAIMALLKQEVRIVLGARSALFSPLPNLGLIVVDEEHDTSFKQDDTPRYHARDVALWRAHHEKATVILGSATPSLESRLNAQLGKLKHLKLLHRASLNSVLPDIEIIDLKSKKDYSESEGQALCILSWQLKRAMKEALERQEQILLFLNRRGYASLAVCDACGHLAQCPNCSVSLTMHHKTNLLRCHQCDYASKPLVHCQKCGEGPVLNLGVGTERVQKEVELAFPDVSVARLDRDSATSAKEINQILADMHSGKTQILIGTQMTAKGHDFSNLTLVGVILADIGLSMPDFRAPERTFQLLAQVAGRAGRRENPGRVLIQTFNPKHPVFEALKKHDVVGFSETDAKFRLEAKQPPYVKAALIRIESPEEKIAQQEAEKIKLFLEAEIKKLGITGQCSLLGPAPAPIEKLRNSWRWQLYLRASNSQIRAQILKNLPGLTLKKSRLIIDIDPVQML